MTFNLLTTVLTTIISALSAAQSRIAAGSGIMSGLAIIEIVLACLWMAMDGASLSEPFKKLMQVSFWFWFASHFAGLVKAFSDSLVRIALSAGGQAGNYSLLLDPSHIAGMALDATKPLVMSMHEAGMTHLGDIFMMGVCTIVLHACFFVIACHVCLAVIEYYLFVTLGSCLIPFGMSQHTRFIAEKAIGAAVAASVKLMVLSFLLAVIQPIFSYVHFTGTGEIQLNEALALCLLCVVLAVVVWRIPAHAADFLAGSPSLSAAHVSQHAGGAASSAAGIIARVAGGGAAVSQYVRERFGKAAAPGASANRIPSLPAGSPSTRSRGSASTPSSNTRV
jgi:type IV secretion system protein TrbL